MTEPQPVLDTTGVWICGACASLDDRNVIYTETNQVDFTNVDEPVTYIVSSYCIGYIVLGLLEEKHREETRDFNNLSFLWSSNTATSRVDVVDSAWVLNR